ncbi:sigma-70 family RNA polymerase sigma factor [Trinickia dinghuensis]|uniref:RNA polymerase subunit sigma-24 n=1 Tax=Trinickia dinghuensis TaxID=2291023 RepID=A0A3D8JUW4_9BURK|nr:sigma-70 family RNA polymerase sigma factor [Trinickia dinghuensis]RDU96384.1 RNA polymerase subunit sigma-24 [Trinickia dinghuensis]
MQDTPNKPSWPDADEARRANLNAILLRIAEGSRPAFTDFYELTAAHVFAVIVRMVRDRGEAEDLLQNVYMNAWRRADSFDPKRGSAMTWLVTLARHRTIDRMREHRETQIDEQQVALIEDDSPTPVDAAQGSEERQRLERCMKALEAKQRGAIREAFFGGATYNELAERHHVPLGTMKSWVRRSLMQLKVCLER